MQRLRLAITRLRKAEDEVKAARDETRLAIIEALDAGVSQSDLVRESGYTRETIRRIARAHGR